MQNGRIVEILNPPIPGGGPLTAMTFAGPASKTGCTLRRMESSSGAR